MEVIVISGFLGAGKTTFIQQLLKFSDKKLCILENELADSIVDKTILQEGSDVTVLELNEGCVCCTLQNDLRSSIISIQSQYEPDYLIIELTGAATLSNVLTVIAEVVYGEVKSSFAITLVDAQQFKNNTSKYRKLIEDQISFADAVILTKCTGLHNDELELLSNEIRKMNPDAVLLDYDYHSLKDAVWNIIFLKYTYEKLTQPKEIFQNNFSTISIKNIGLKNFQEAMALMELCVSGAFGDIPRAKGILPCGYQWVQFEIVGQKYTISGYHPVDTSNVVFIGNYLKKYDIRKFFINLNVSNTHK